MYYAHLGHAVGCRFNQRLIVKKIVSSYKWTLLAAFSLLHQQMVAVGMYAKLTVAYHFIVIPSRLPIIPKFPIVQFAVDSGYHLLISKHNARIVSQTYCSTLLLVRNAETAHLTSGGAVACHESHVGLQTVSCGQLANGRKRVSTKNIQAQAT